MRCAVVPVSTVQDTCLRAPFVACRWHFASFSACVSLERELAASTALQHCSLLTFGPKS